MIISVEKLNRKETEKTDLNFSENIDTISYREDVFNLASPLNLQGAITKSKSGLYIDVDVDFTILESCSRCLKDVKVPLNYNIQGFLVKDEDYIEDEFEDFDAFFYNGSEIDLLDIVEQTLDFNLPSKVLCDEQCKGLCYKCGADLNIKECSCNEDTNDEGDIDPRFAKLKDLFKND
ncbi:MAG: DUF177 domain-containing protein [Clostridioides difficile]|nr:DUF177 domain-containing protein [Clostridioides sp.]MBS5786480.1 DUF177 domain-containing protein [Clostridioides difficile]